MASKPSIQPRWRPNIQIAIGLVKEGNLSPAYGNCDPGASLAEITYFARDGPQIANDLSQEEASDERRWPRDTD